MRGGRVAGRQSSCVWREPPSTALSGAGNVETIPLLRPVLVLVVLAVVFAPGQLDVTLSAEPGQLTAAVLAPTSDSDAAVKPVKEPSRSPQPARGLTVVTLGLAGIGVLAVASPASIRQTPEALCRVMTVAESHVSKRGPPVLLV